MDALDLDTSSKRERPGMGSRTPDRRSDCTSLLQPTVVTECLQVSAIPFVTEVWPGLQQRLMETLP